jgi:hypothetical protein
MYSNEKIEFLIIVSLVYDDIVPQFAKDPSPSIGRDPIAIQAPRRGRGDESDAHVAPDPADYASHVRNPHMTSRRSGV